MTPAEAAYHSDQGSDAFYGFAFEHGDRDARNALRDAMHEDDSIGDARASRVWLSRRHRRFGDWGKGEP